MRNAATEAQEQAALLAWWRMACKAYKLPESALLHIPNEGKRSVVTGRLLKHLGLRPGTPDLFLAVPKSNVGGLWLEMKRQHGGRVQQSQKDMLTMLAALGYAVHVCHGFDEAKRQIERYLR